ncbi:hypothetical protein AVEN_215734-1 [Araneus ventricosus]|uniref:Uncharacterized protein n=1 Tax=Araneus ventricosus TaxID=182803 RepID=A0A4Y2FKM5_ARAVE|nr:hypothetical protein AVEN_215734-1 [Araneus ventricosus]
MNSAPPPDPNPGFATEYKQSAKTGKSVLSNRFRHEDFKRDSPSTITVPKQKKHHQGRATCMDVNPVGISVPYPENQPCDQLRAKTGKSVRSSRFRHGDLKSHSPSIIPVPKQKTPSGSCHVHGRKPCWDFCPIAREPAVRPVTG